MASLPNGGSFWQYERPASKINIPVEGTGTVLDIHDGDTFSALIDGKKVIIRLNGIDTPEIGQEYGLNAKAELSTLIGKSEFIYISSGFGRTCRNRIFALVFSFLPNNLA